MTPVNSVNQLLDCSPWPRRQSLPTEVDMKDLSLRRSLSERKLAKKERKDKTRSAHFERSLTPISIIGEKRENSTPPTTMNGDVDYGTIGGKRNKFWKLKVTNVIPIIA